MQPNRHVMHGLSHLPEYAAWHRAKRRCFEPSHKSFMAYGGRGITMCHEWASDFGAFYSHVGPKPSPRHSLDRIDNNRGYEPGNCRWADEPTQKRNTRRNRWITVGGETLTITDWARRMGVSTAAVYHRLEAGWDTSLAVTTPSARRV